MTSRGSRDAPIRRRPVSRDVYSRPPARRVPLITPRRAFLMSALARRRHRRGGALVAPRFFSSRASPSSPRSAWRSSRTRVSATTTPAGTGPTSTATVRPLATTSEEPRASTSRASPAASIRARATSSPPCAITAPTSWSTPATSTTSPPPLACGAASWTRRYGAPAWTLAVKGNHDADGWDGVQWLWNGDPDGYAAQLRPTLPAGADCRGEYGAAMVCDYRGVTLVLSDVGVDVAGLPPTPDNDEHIDRALREEFEPVEGVRVAHEHGRHAGERRRSAASGWGIRGEMGRR